MRVVILCETFSQNMGYLTAILPKYLARLDLDVHVVSLDLSAYHSDGEWSGAPPSFLTDQVMAPGSVTATNGYTVHVLRHGRLGRFPFAKSLGRKLAEIGPEVVYSATAIGALPIQTAVHKLRLGYRLFTGSHTSPSTFPLATMQAPFLSVKGIRCLLTRWIPGRLVSLLTSRCYCRTRECAEIAVRFFGVQRQKVTVVPLGVDTDFFFPARSASELTDREDMRRRLGFGERDIVCIYTGRLVESKRVLRLAEAVERLRDLGLPYRALCIGDGPDRERLCKLSSCKVIGFMPFAQLGPYYRAADIGVWPGTESTSIFDAAACGLPIVCNQKIAGEHLLDNGLGHRHDDLESLTDCLKHLSDPAKRRRLGDIGARRAIEELGWHRAAAIRLSDFTSGHDDAVFPDATTRAKQTRGQ